VVDAFTAAFKTDHAAAKVELATNMKLNDRTDRSFFEAISSGNNFPSKIIKSDGEVVNIGDLPQAFPDYSKS
jgi:hypothetical protein